MVSKIGCVVSLPSVKIYVLILSNDSNPWRDWEEIQAKLLQAQGSCNQIAGIRWIRGQKPKTTIISSFALFVLAAWSRSTLAPIFFRLSRGRFGVSAGSANRKIDPSALIDDGKYLRCTTPEAFALIAVKTIESMAYVLRHNPDVSHFYRTNSSSYVHLEGLARFVQNNPSINYGGVIGEFGGTQFASGAGALISRRAAEILIENSGKVRVDLIDDVAMAKVLEENDLSPVSIPRIDLLRLGNREFSEFGAQEIPPECFHARCKDGSYTPILLERASRIFSSQKSTMKRMDEDV